MKKVRVYTTNYCPYCTRAKELLSKKKVFFEEIDVTHNAEMRHKLVELTGGRTTVPQIFIENLAVGGFDDIAALDKAGKLDDLLKD